MRSTSPAIQPRPSVTSYSRPRSAISCMPTQMPRNGRPLPRTRFLERLDHARHRIEPAPAIGEGADAGQHHAVGAAHRVGIAGHHDRLGVPALARRALERLGRRMQIAGAVIDDGDAHRGAPGSGNRPMTSERRPSAWPAEPSPAPRLRASRCQPAIVEPCVLNQASKKRRSAVSRSVADHDADVPSSRGATASSAAALPPRSRRAARSARPRRAGPFPMRRSGAGRPAARW